MGGIIASILKAPPFSLRNRPADEHSTYAGYAFRLETLAGCFGPWLPWRQFLWSQGYEYYRINLSALKFFLPIILGPLESHP